MKKKYIIIGIAGIAIAGVAAYLIFKPAAATTSTTASTPTTPVIQSVDKVNGKATITYNGTTTTYDLSNGQPQMIGNSGYSITCQLGVFDMYDKTGKVVTAM